MDLRMLAPIVGEFYTAAPTPFFPQDEYPFLKLSTIDYAQRFAVILGDDGLENWGIRRGDYLLFRRQGWPTEHRQLCFIHFGDEAILRIIPDMWASEIELLAANDEYPPISTHRNQFVVTGVCCGIRRPDDEIEIVYPE
ncbi:LexA family protein [Effusibacillus pohliae]|uniref:LexA family protein n=1 Tax=Effusibacillus pohliae TaxID=232270 RepID=UPI0003657C06|nr:S24 family peptidase [Effusibacillus pohliae]